MQTTYSYNAEAENYWKLLKNASSEVKLRLIALLSQSLMKKEPSDTKAIPTSSTEKFINRFSGRMAWKRYRKGNHRYYSRRPQLPQAYFV